MPTFIMPHKSCRFALSAKDIDGTTICQKATTQRTTIQKASPIRLQNKTKWLKLHPTC